ncbi:hypothetical protein WMY93_012647 [Mugilogobius chulae]|uniref:Alpha/beta hydrolase fold-3 domain-containing protein n=1 Tax=Mugilogobius chulae TaxID=88201 RepID=A0AAW0P9M8_9GOBI
MKPVVFTLFLTAFLAYYIYTPLPEGLQEQWKLMLLDTTFRTATKYAGLKRWLGYDYTLSIREFRALDPGADDQFVPVVKVSDETFAGVPVRVYEAPGGEGKLRRGLMMMSAELDAVVVSVEYRLFPEVQFPVPYLDCLAAAKHFLSSEILSKYSVDPERVAVSGDSAGGNLAAAVSQEISQDSSVRVKFSVQALIYPAVQALDFNTPSALQNQNVPILYRLTMAGSGCNTSEPTCLCSLQQSRLTPELRSRFDWTQLLSPEHKKTYKPVVPSEGLEGILEKIPGLLDVRAFPILAESEVLSKCPKAYVLTCELTF